jgi:hypothetical protein
MSIPNEKSSGGRRHQLVADATPRKPRRPKTKAEQERDAERSRRAFQRLRIGDLNKLFRHRYGGDESWTFPDDDAGRDDLRILADHYVTSNPLRFAKVVAMRAPWMTGAELGDFLADVGRFPRFWTIGDLTEEFGLAESERKALGVRTIRAIDMTPEQREEAQKLREKERKKAMRRTNGAKPHDESAARTKPWETAGVSRRTWYRQQAKSGGTDSSAMNLMNTEDELVPLSKRPRRPYHAGECPGEALRIRLPAPVAVGPLPGTPSGHDRDGRVPAGMQSEPGMANLVSAHRRASQISESCRDEPVPRMAA